MLYIGASSAFFFVGTAEEYRQQRAAINKGILDRKRHILRQREDKLRLESSRPENEKDKELVEKLRRRVQEAIDDIEATKPLEERKVRETYRCAGGKVILVEGNEDGIMWERDEWKEPTKGRPIIANAELLADAIVKEAAKDYATELKYRKKHGTEKSEEEQKLEQFFLSRRFARLSAIDGEELMLMIEQRANKAARRERKK